MSMPFTQGTDDTVKRKSIAGMWIFRIGAAYLFAGIFGIGALGVWLAMVCDWLFRAVVFSIRWLSGKWKAYRVV